MQPNRITFPALHRSKMITVIYLSPNCTSRLVKRKDTDLRPNRECRMGLTGLVLVCWARVRQHCVSSGLCNPKSRLTLISSLGTATLPSTLMSHNIKLKMIC